MIYNCNVEMAELLIPLLLRCLHHIASILSYYLNDAHRMENNTTTTTTTTTTTNANTNIPTTQVKKMLASIAIIALSFLPPKDIPSTHPNRNPNPKMSMPDYSTSTPDSWNALQIIPKSMLSKLSLASLISSCALPPDAQRVLDQNCPALHDILSPSSSPFLTPINGDDGDNDNGDDDKGKDKSTAKQNPLNESTMLHGRNVHVPTQPAIWAASGVIRRVSDTLLKAVEQCTFILSDIPTRQTDTFHNTLSMRIRTTTNTNTNTTTAETDATDATDATNATNATTSTLVGNLTKCFGSEMVSHICRSYFFDKSTRTHLASSMEEELDLSPEHYVIPSHIHGVLHLLTCLSFPIPQSSLNHILPICYTLLDHSFNTYYSTLGAALLLRMYTLTTPTNLYLHWTNIEHISYSVWKGGCRNQMWNLTLVAWVRTELMNVLKDHDTTLSRGGGGGSSTSSLSSTTTTIASKRREWTLDLFVLLKRRVFTRRQRGNLNVQENDDDDDDDEVVQLDTNDNDDEDLILPLLWTGICPLLAQHAAMARRKDNTRRRDSDAMEISTDGISALLLLLESLDWDVEHIPPNGEIQFWILPITTMIAMISLLMSTYPAMTFHGGKIMCALLSSLGHCDENIQRRRHTGQSSQRHGDEEEQQQQQHILMTPISTTKKSSFEYAQVFISLTLHAASVALVLCEKRAGHVLDRVEEKCMDSLVHRCHEIREGAKLLLLKRQKE